MTNLLELGCWDKAGNIRVVVEAPKGSTAKFKYDPALAAFELQRFIGDAGYPYHWGFVPSTQAADGDPLDALVIDDSVTWPGVIIPSIAIGLLKIAETPDGAAEPRRNDRMIAVPSARQTLHSVNELSSQQRAALERFFVATGELAKKRVVVEGWGDPGDASVALRSAHAEYSNKR